MRYKGATVYQSFTSGLFSTILTIMVTYFTIGQVVQLVGKIDPSMQVHTVYHKESELGSKTGKELHFDIGIGVYKLDEGTMVKNIDGYGKFSFYQFKVENM